MAEIIWNYFFELRKELREAQKIRAQIIGFKIAFISAVYCALLTNITNAEPEIFVLPALASVFFDFLICSYSFSIIRIGSYIREHIEPAIIQLPEVPDDFILWQKYLTQPKTRQYLANYGNSGLTLLSVLLAGYELTNSTRHIIPTIMAIILLIFVIIDIYKYLEPRKLGKIWAKHNFNDMTKS